jgi:SEFIR domain-containing protein
MAPSAPRVFISYSHDSTDHTRAVLALAQRLRQDGVDAWIDQYENGTPEEGWPRWMLNRLDWAQTVLLVCTEIYYRRFRGHDDPDQGKGVDWEGQLITLDLYNAKSRKVNIVPILFSDLCKKFIPEPLRGVTHYLFDPGDAHSATEYSRLIAFFHGKAGVAPVPLGLPQEVANRQAQPMVFAKEKAIGSRRQPTPPLRDQKAARRPGNPRNAGKTPTPQSPGPVFYAIVALVAFLLGFMILGVMLWNAPLLVSLGLTGNFYYVLLLTLGLSAAIVLFGVLQSRAVYRGNTGWGRLELGGAIVGCALVVAGGFSFVPNPLPFAITVFVHDEGGIHELVPKDSGEVCMELGPEVRRQEIGPNGSVYLTNIPPTYRGQPVQVWVDSKQFESVNPEQKQPLKGDSIQLAVRKKTAKYAGWVRDADGDGPPIPNAKLNLDGLPGTTDSGGHFEFVIPGDRLMLQMEIEIAANGYDPARYPVALNSEHVVLHLKKSH